MFLGNKTFHKGHLTLCVINLIYVESTSANMERGQMATVTFVINKQPHKMYSSDSMYDVKYEEL